MNCIVVAGSDKISLNHLILFLSKRLNDFQIGTMHSLMSLESVDMYLKDFFLKYSKGLISYYARGEKGDVLTIVPIGLLRKAEYLIWFDLYSVDPKIVKSSGGVLEPYLEAWKQVMKSMLI